jgi:hypothetical protein
MGWFGILEAEVSLRGTYCTPVGRTCGADGCGGTGGSSSDGVWEEKVVKVLKAVTLKTVTRRS